MGAFSYSHCALKVFTEIFAKFFEVFSICFEVFVRFSRFSDLFGPIQICSDPLGGIRMHSDAFESVQTFSIFFFAVFELVFDGFGRIFIKRIFSRQYVHSFSDILLSSWKIPSAVDCLVYSFKGDVCYQGLLVSTVFPSVRTCMIALKTGRHRKSEDRRK